MRANDLVYIPEGFIMNLQPLAGILEVGLIVGIKRSISDVGGRLGHIG